MTEAAEVAEAVPPATEEPKEQIEVKDASSGNAEESTEELPESEATGDPDAQDVDAELEEMKQRLAQMEAESAGAKEGTAAAGPVQGQPIATNGAAEAGNEIAGASSANPALAAGGPTRIPLTTDGASDADERSIYVGNVDYSATGDQLSAHFTDCGTINRVTIMCDKATGQPKGFAYIEFDDHNAAQNALILNESTFLGRQLKVVPKRTNVPGVYRGRFARGRPRYTRGGRGYPRRPRRSWRGRWAPY